MESRSLEKWIWMELIGFDNSLPDYGVKAYLDNCGFVPDGVSLLLTWIEFPMQHLGLDRERLLSPCECSYGAHPANAQRRRQNWTNFQLRDLIHTLQNYGIRVYLSFFNITDYVDESGQRILGEFYKKHPYLSETNRFGKAIDKVHMLKKMADGSLFEDLFLEKVIKTLTDYGFDGIQIADGISSGRLSLQEGDYSDNMVQQFLEETPLADVAPIAQGEEAMLARAAQIWQNHRGKWIEFHRRRWLQFYEKFADRLKKAGKEGIFNNAWTRDPFEALYRYGVDYRAIGKLGFRGCMPEDVSAGLAILSQEDNGYLMTPRQREQIHYDFLANLMQSRAAMPQLRLIPLAGVHDMMEQWGVLEHMPTSMTRNVLCNLNTLFWNGKSYQPIEDGPWFCLGDCISQEQWTFIRNNWDLGEPPKNVRPAGPAWLWSDSLMDNELQAFIVRRQAPGCYLLPRLLQAGAPLHAIVRIEDLDTYAGDLVVPNPALLPEAEQKLLRNYNRGTVYTVGQTGADTRITFGKLGEQPLCVGDLEEAYTFDPVTGMESVRMLWTHPIAYPSVREEFFREAAKVLQKDLPVLIKYDQRCELLATRLGENKWRIFVGNDDYFYNIPTVDMKKKIVSAQRLTGYAGFPVPVEGTTFRCRVPGRGMEAFEVIV